MGSIPTPPTTIIMIVFFVLFTYGFYLTYRGTVTDWQDFNPFHIEDIIIGIVIMTISVILTLLLMGII